MVCYNEKQVLLMKHLSNADTETIHLRGITETWYFDIEVIKDLGKSFWEMVTGKKWKVPETGISYNDLFPYGSKDGLLSSFCHTLLVSTHLHIQIDSSLRLSLFRPHAMVTNHCALSARR
jgi:hypothetical protein